MDLSHTLKSLINILSNNQLYSKKYLCLQLKCDERTLINYIKQLEDLGLNIVCDDSNTYIHLINQLCLLDPNYVAAHIPFDELNYFYKINSTNTFLQNSSNLAATSLCITESQTQGKGQRSNSWHSPFGQNLYYSLFCTVKKNDIPIITLSPLIALAIIKTLTQLQLTDIGIKWPNDIYLQGAKLGGVLTEIHSTNYQTNMISIIIGIGLNLTMQQANQQEISQHWISLANILPVHKINKNELVISLSQHISQVLQDFNSNNFNYLTAMFNQYDVFLNQKVVLFNKDLKIEGIERGINDKGELLIENNTGIINKYAIGNLSLRLK